MEEAPYKHFQLAKILKKVSTPMLKISFRGLIYFQSAD